MSSRFFRALAAGAMFILSGQAGAQQYACVGAFGDSNEYNPLHEQGYVATGYASLFRCDSGYAGKFERDPGSRICSPSTDENLPDNYAVTGKTTCRSGSYSDGGLMVTDSPQTICGNYRIPVGYVAYETGIDDGTTTGNSECTSTFGDNPKIRVKRPSRNGETIKCSFPDHPIPDGFVEVPDSARDGYSQCPGSSPNSSRGPGIKIALPRAGMTVCSTVPVPGGLVYSQTVDVGDDCTSGTGFILSELTDSGGRLCARSVADVPEGFVVQSITDDGVCEGLYSTFMVVRPNPNGQPVCDLLGTQIPEGFVRVPSFAQTFSCDGHGGFIIEIPTGSQHAICQDSPIPDGWVLTSRYDNANGCPFEKGAIIEDLSSVTGSGPYEICSGQSLPDGWVITEVISSPGLIGCSDTLGAWVIERPSDTPGSETRVCAMAPNDIPSGFAIKENDSYDECNKNPGSKSVGFYITRPSPSGETVTCSNSPTVPGFAVTGRGDSARCGVGLNDGDTEILAPATGLGTYSYCSISAIPENFVITAVVSGGLCGSVPTYEVQSVTGDDKIVCRQSTVPENYVVKQILSSTSSCSLGRYEIGLPNTSGPTFICSVATVPVPDGYVQVSGSSQTRSICDGGAGYQIVPVGGPAIVPNDFVNDESDVTDKPVDPVVICNTANANYTWQKTSAKNAGGCN